MAARTTQAMRPIPSGIIGIEVRPLPEAPDADWPGRLMLFSRIQLYTAEGGLSRGAMATPEPRPRPDDLDTADCMTYSATRTEAYLESRAGFRPQALRLEDHMSMYNIASLATEAIENSRPEDSNPLGSPAAAAFRGQLMDAENAEVVSKKGELQPLNELQSNSVLLVLHRVVGEQRSSLEDISKRPRLSGAPGSEVALPLKEPATVSPRRDGAASPCPWGPPTATPSSASTLAAVMSPSTMGGGRCSSNAWDCTADTADRGERAGASLIRELHQTHQGLSFISTNEAASIAP